MGKQRNNKTNREKRKRRRRRNPFKKHRFRVPGPGLKKYRLFAKNLFKTSRFWAPGWPVWAPGQAASRRQKLFSHVRPWGHGPKLEILIDPGSASNFIKASSHMLEHFSLWTRKAQTLKPTHTFLICGGGGVLLLIILLILLLLHDRFSSWRTKF